MQLEQPILGFSQSLISHLESSREKLQIYIEKQKLQADATRVGLCQLKAQEQDTIIRLLQHLKDIQYQRGVISVESSSRVEVTEETSPTLINTATHLSNVKLKQVQQENDLVQAQASLSEIQAHLEGTSILFC